MTAKCIRCNVQTDIDKWAENGFVCPACDQWFCGPLRRNYLAAAMAEHLAKAAQQ
jgi:hypothetical protein